MRAPRFRSVPRLLTHVTSFIFMLLLAPAIVAQTQSTTGTMEVLVFDANGAAVPGANVEIKSLDTNATRTGSTDDDGRFVALQLQPGPYSVTVSKQGFTTGNLQSTQVTVGDTKSIRVNLTVSGVAEQVTITETLVVDTAKTQVSTTVNELAVSTTPILGRKFLDLLTLTPGVAITQGPDGDEINFAGQRGVFNNVTLDGGDYNNGFFGEQLGGQRAAIDITLEA